MAKKKNFGSYCRRISSKRYTITVISNSPTSTHEEDLESYAKNKTPTRWLVNFVYKQIGLTVQQYRRVKVNPKIFFVSGRSRFNFFENHSR